MNRILTALISFLLAGALVAHAQGRRGPQGSAQPQQSGLNMAALTVIEGLNPIHGKGRIVAVLDTPASNLAVSPDGRYIAWDQLDKRIHDLMLVDGFK